MHILTLKCAVAHFFCCLGLLFGFCFFKYGANITTGLYRGEQDWRAIGRACHCFNILKWIKTN